MRVFLCLFAVLSSLQSINGQWSSGYNSAPTYVQSFDEPSTSSQLIDSIGGYQWINQSQGRTGLAYLNRRLANYIDLQSMSDNYGVRLIDYTSGPEFSFECWLLARDWFSWQRIFDFSINDQSATQPNTYTSNSRGNAITLQHGPGGNAQYGYQISNNQTTTNAYTPNTAGRIGEWAHIAVTSQIVNDTDINSIYAARHSVYVNGVLAFTNIGYLPRRLVRNLHWLARSAAVLNGDNFMTGFFDMFAVYNTPLPSESIIAHMQTNRPPRLELTFAKNPTTLQSVTQPTYSWSDTSDNARINGTLSFNGVNQFIDLLTSSGASSAGTAMRNAVNGLSGGLSSINPSNGWSYTTIVKINQFTASASIFDMKGSGSDRVRMFITSTGSLVFNINQVTITSTTNLVIGQWYHLTASVNRAGVSTLYINQQIAGTQTGTGLVEMTVSSAYLARSTDAVPIYLNGQIDSFRFYDKVLSLDEVRALSNMLVSAPTGVSQPFRLSQSVTTAPLVSYTFSRPMGEFGSAGLSNHTWAQSRGNRRGVASLNGRDQHVALRDYADDYGKYIPTLFGGSMTFEANIQFLDLSNQAPVWSFSGPRSYSDNNIHIINTYAFDAGNINSLRAEQYTGSAMTSLVTCRGCTNGSWISLTKTIYQEEASANAVMTIYANGQFIGSFVGPAPPVTHRPNLNIGLPAWAGDSPTAMNIDSFFWYSYALSAEAVAAHFVLPLPPSYELCFDLNPNIRNDRSFGWIRNDTTGIHDGIISLSGSQFVDLAATSGPNSISAGVRFPEMFGNNQNTPGVQSAIANGWSFDVVFKPTSVAAGSTIVEFSSTGGANLLRLAFATNKLVFSHGSTELDCGSILVNEWTHVSITIARDRDDFEGQCWVNGERVISYQSFPGVAYVSRTNAFLGKSATLSNSFFQGEIDAFRILPYSLNSEDVRQLYIAYSSERNLVDPPTFQSGPVVSYTFDKPPEVQIESDTAVTFNYYPWQLEAPAYARNDSHRGVAVFADIEYSFTSRKYVDMNFDADAYGATLPQRMGNSMSFETWTNIGLLQPYQRIVDIGEDDTAGLGPADGSGKFNLILSAGALGSTMQFESYYAQGTADRMSIPNAWLLHQWTYVVGVFDATTLPARMSVYINGVLRGTMEMTAPPPVVTRRVAYMARSNWNNTMLNGTIDSLYVYNYALTPDAINLRMRLTNPPLFEASFERNPSVNPDFANYGWQALNSQFITHTGELTFSGNDQYVNLNSGSGNSSIGQNFPQLAGPSIGISQDGFTLELSCRWSNLSHHSKVIDLANGQGNRNGVIGIDSFAIGNDGPVIQLYVNNGDTDETDIIPLFGALVNTYYHFIVIATPVFNRTDVVDYTLYHNGDLIRSWPSKIAPQSLLRSRVYIGRSNTRGDSFFSGGIDLIRYYNYAVTPSIATFLARRSGTNGPYISPESAPRPSSSSTGSVVSSTSSPRPSSSSSSPAVTSIPSSSTATVTSAAVASSSTAGVEAGSSSSSSLGGGAIAGIVIGAVVGVALICAALFCFCIAGRTGGKMRKLDEERVEDSRTTGEAYSMDNEVELQNV